MLVVVEPLVREAAFACVLILGALVLAGGTCATAVWALKALLRVVGLYSDFVAFSSSRRKKQK